MKEIERWPKHKRNCLESDITSPEISFRHTRLFRKIIYSDCMIASPWPSVFVKSKTNRSAHCNPTNIRTHNHFPHITMASIASDDKHKCVAVVLHLKDVQKEMSLLDHATRAADERILLVLLGKQVYISQNLIANMLFIQFGS
jgi:hypothetical protein